MIKNKFIISSIRKIKESYKRFISLLFLSLLGVGFFAGIEVTSPDMLKTLDKYLDNQNVYDIEIISTIGLTKEDEKEISKIINLDQIEGIYSKDSIIKINNKDRIIDCISVSDNINKIIIKEGNYPKEKNEILVEEKLLLENKLKIGDYLELDKNQFKNNKYKIVGIVQSPYYFSEYRKTSNVGNGKIDYYVYINKDNFDQDYYNSIYITLKDTKELLTNSKQYNNKINTTLSKIEHIKLKREKIRKDEVLNKYQISKNNQINTSLTSKWYISTRQDNIAYRDFIDSTEGVKKIGNVFPIIFYSVAILISLISMMRMIEEDRQQIGTLKALGFSTNQIIYRYLLYSLLATLIGGVLGVSIGFILIPNIIWSIYRQIFFIPNFIYEFNLLYAFLGIFIAIICICGTTLIVVIKTLRNFPADLMREKSPKVGKKILIEQIKPLWKRLNFSNKITFRNIFRYKGRMFVTIIGVAGCTALVLTGFGLRDSIKDLANNQYQKVFRYDKLVQLKSNNKVLEKSLKENNQIQYIVPVMMKHAKILSDKNKQESNLIIVNDSKSINNVINLRNINSKKRINIKSNSIVLSEKLARKLNIKINDKVNIQINNQTYEIIVNEICENYIGDYAYITKNTYNKYFQDYYENVLLIKTNKLSNKQKQKIEQEIVKDKNTIALITSEETYKMIDNMMMSLDSVVLILIISSALLAFIIMYNLSNINISERRKEIATLKVLGFYDKEVDSYINRESTILTIIGIISGLIIGLYLSHFIISSCEPQDLLFVRHISWQSYIYATLITILFMIIVNIISHIYLRNINMTDSLKSID